MAKPAGTMALPHFVTTTVRCSTKSNAVTRGESLDALLDECPARLDGIEVRRVGRQVFEPGADLLDDFADTRVMVSLCVVHDDDVARRELRRERVRDPFDEALAVCSLEERAHRDPT